MKLPGKNIFHTQVLVQSIGNKAAGGFHIFNSFESSLDSGFGITSETSKNVGEHLIGFDIKYSIFEVKLSSESINLLNLGRILELKRGKKISSRDDGSGGEVVSDLSTFRGLDWHNHLHGFNFDVGLSSFDLGTIILEITDNLSSDISTELRGVKDSGHEDSGTIKNKTKSKRFILTKNAVGLSSKCSKDGTFSSLSDTGVNHVLTKSQTVDISSLSFDMERVLGVLISNLKVEGIDLRDSSDRNLTLGERLLDLLRFFLCVLSRNV